MKNGISLLRLLRISRGLNLYEAGRAANISAGQLSLIERGLIIPKRYTLEKILEVYDMEMLPGEKYDPNFFRKICATRMNSEKEV